MRHASDYNIDRWPRKEISDYDKKDYRSKFYKGKWFKVWLDNVAEKAFAENKKPEEVMWKLCDAKTEHIPKSLFKFFPFNKNSLKCIEEGTVYLNTPENFNDPYDCYLAVDKNEFVKRYLLDRLKITSAVERGVISEHEYQKIVRSICKESRNSLNEHIYSMFDSVLTHINLEHPNNNEIREICFEAIKLYENKTDLLRKEQFRIASFSKLKKEELVSYMEMWGHYANNHSGFCVEYDMGSNVDGEKWDKILMGGLLPCSYSAQQHKIPNYTFYKYVLSRKLTKKQTILMNKAIITSMLSKSSSWSYEKEWRLILPNELCNIYNNLLPFYKIKAIYLGCKMSLLDKEYMYKLCMQNNIDVFDMRLKDDYYEFDLVSIDVENKMKDRNFLRKVQTDNYLF